MSHTETSPKDVKPQVLRVRVQGQKINTLKDTAKITYNRYVRSFAEEHARQCQERQQRRDKVEAWRKESLGKKSRTTSKSATTTLQLSVASSTNTPQINKDTKPTESPVNNSIVENKQENKPESSAADKASDTANSHGKDREENETTEATDAAFAIDSNDMEDSISQIRVIGGEGMPPHEENFEYMDESSEMDPGAGQADASNSNSSGKEETNEKSGDDDGNNEASSETISKNSEETTSFPVMIGRQKLKPCRVGARDMMAYLGGGGVKSRPQSFVALTTGMNHYMFRTWEEILAAGKNGLGKMPPEKGRKKGSEKKKSDAGKPSGSSPAATESEEKKVEETTEETQESPEDEGES